LIEFNIPGREPLSIEHIVFDVNGTLALDGQLLDGITRKVHSLRDRLQIHLITADTHGKQFIIDEQLSLNAVRLEKGKESEQKTRFVDKLGNENVIAIGQGANDSGMLKSAAIGICILSPEGTAIETIQAADILVSDIYTALDLIDHPLRMVATLRK